MEIIEVGRIPERNKRKYFSAHNHTEYSNLRLLDSINTVSGLIARAKELGLAGFAITDHEVLSSHVQAVQAYQKMIKDGMDPNDFKIVLGDEIYLVPDVMEIKKNYTHSGHTYYHFIVLAKDKEGYDLLREMSSTAWGNGYSQRGMERVPIDYKQLATIAAKNPGHLIGSSSCLAGQMSKLIMKLHEAEKEFGPQSREASDLKSRINEFLTMCCNIFGKDDFYLEVQPSMNEEQLIVNSRLKSIANFYGLKLIYTTDSHYAKKEDRFVHKAYLNSMDGEREVDDFYGTTYMMDMDELWDYLQVTFTREEFDEMTRNTLEIADKCQAYDLYHDQVIPEIDITGRLADLKAKYEDKIELDWVLNNEYIQNMLDSDSIQDQYWIYSCIEGMHQRVLGKPLSTPTATYWARINEEAKELWEISKIIKDSMTKYYNTMQYIIELVWDKGNSLVGPARGSATGFLTCYLQGITQLDPIVWNLPHWRHLTATRPELPDIDFDTMATRRRQILEAVKEVFGAANVLNIATFGTEGPRSACLTACRGYRSEEFPEGIDVDIAQYLTSMIPSERGQTWPLHDCVYGDEEKERRPLHQFIAEVNKYPGLLEIMFAIEGIVNKRSIHASGVYIYNHGYLQFNAMMKAPNGQAITQFNMNDSDYMGSLKYDFLTVEALDKIGVAMDLLLEDNVIQWQGSLKKTYDKYIHPDVLDYNNQEMWNLMGTGQVINLFQFDTAVGSQCAKKGKPGSLPDAANLNSLMRLVAEHGQEQPIDKYLRFKNNIKLWYAEMAAYGLTQDEVKVLEPHLLPVFGVANTQEDVMEMVMNPKIGNFTLQDANKLRKGIAKKKAKIIADAKDLFYSKGLEAGTRKQLLDYIWIIQITPQLGYSFSRNHTTPYTAIALQELNLYYNYPSIYWNTACLTVNAGSADEDALDKKSTDYAKVAVAIGDIASRGVIVSLADINRSRFGFKPDAENDEIIFGLKGINNVGDDLVRTIIENRPYANMFDFMSKVKVGRQAMIALIKGGAFDRLEGKSRVGIMADYILATCEPKKRLTLQNFNGLINAGLIPEELEYEVRVFNFNKMLKAHCKVSDYYALPEPFMKFYEQFFNTDILEVVGNYPAVKQATWDKAYKKVMDGARAWLKTHHDETLATYNNMLFEADWNKYCKGNLSAWEMESISFYHGAHELKDVNKSKYGISDFDQLPEIPEVDYYFKRGGKDIPIFKLTRIVGTVIGKNKVKGMVSLLTTSGVVNVKFRPDFFAMYDKQLSEKKEDGTKKITEKSWFTKGSKLMITGYRRDSQWVPKTYKNTPTHTLYKIDDVLENGDISLRSER
jgi:DNA polymerase-3 subunit alpha